MKVALTLPFMCMLYVQAEVRNKLEYSLHQKDIEVEELSAKAHRLDAALRVSKEMVAACFLSKILYMSPPSC